MKFVRATEARQTAAKRLELAPASQGVEDEAALAFAMAGDTARADSLAQDLGKRFPLDTQMQSLWLPAIQAQLALGRKNPAVALNVHRPIYPSSWAASRSVTVPASIRRMYAARHTWQPGRATLLPPSFRKSSITAALSGTAGREHLLIWGWLAPMPCSREPRRERMPMPPASERSPPTKIF